MIEHLNVNATIVFVAFFALVTVMGFYAARWKAGDLTELAEWGLGGRRFGAWITWFLLGGDLYTAYTVIAVPGVVYAAGAYGFFAVPYTILIYPFLFLTFPRLWNVSHKRGYITASDFVFGRYGNKWLELAVALTGILATMPYIALQLVGMEVVIKALGFQGEGLLAHLPLTIAFVILALYTYSSGLRAPAMIAFVKDIMIYIFVIAAVVIIPAKLGGYQQIFTDAARILAAKKGNIILGPAQIVPFMTLAFGSAMALFIYPHSLTGILSASSGKTIKRNAMMLPAYSLVLGLIAILGLMALAAGIETKNSTEVVPLLFLKMFPDWFVGFCFAAIAIGALVPAAVMSIGAANTFTRNVWRPFINPNLSGAAEAQLAKIMSLVVKLGALVVIVYAPTKFAIDLQLLGGVWMLQIFPALVFGLYTRWFNPVALLIGWALGMGIGSSLAFQGDLIKNLYPLFTGGPSVYIGILAVVVNIASAAILTLVLPRTTFDETKAGDYVPGGDPVRVLDIVH